MTQEVQKKSNKGLLIALLVIFGSVLLGLGIDFTEFSQHEDIQIPVWFFYVVFLLNFLAVDALIFIYLRKKVAVYAFPVIILLHFLAHQYYLSTFLYTDILTLFLFVGIGLLFIIPIWDEFK